MTHIADLQLIGQSEDVVAALSVYDDPEAQVGYGFTAMFEARVISLLQEANISAAAGMLTLAWDQVDGIMARAAPCGAHGRGAVSSSAAIIEPAAAHYHRHESVSGPDEI